MKKIDKGGITYGRSHAEGGIPVKNESTGEMLEVEGGEGIINKKAMASPQMVKIDGKEMTICEAASYLNQKDGNGRQFNCDDVEHQQFLTDHYGVGGELKKGIATEKEHSKTLNKLYNQDINPNQAIREVAKEHIKENPNYYSDLHKMEGKMAKGGTVMNNQDAENAIFDATVFEHGGTVNAYDAGLHKKMYMLGIEVMQPDPIALARVMSDENDNFCEHYPKLCAGAEYQREELPQIYDKNYDEFVAYLENLGATVNFEGDTAVDSLKPVQNEISLERMARIMARVKDGYYKDLNLLKLPLFVSQDGYILDGHHRWATLFFLSPTNTLDIYRVNLTYKELVDNALNFDDAGTEKFLIGGMVKKQEQLDKAFKNPSINDKKRISYYDIEYDADFTDLFRMEGSSQAMLKTKIASGVTANYRNLGSLVTKLFNTYVVPTAKDKYVTETTSRGFTYNWLIKLEDIESKDKRSYAYDWFLDKRDSSYGVLEFFQSGNLNYNKDSAKIFTMALSVFVERVIYAVKQNSTFSSFDDFVAYLDLPIKVLAENIKNILIQISEIDTNQPVTRYEWVTETNYRNQNQTAPTNANTPSTVNMQGTYSYFDVAYKNASGEIKYDFTDPPKDCRVEIACNIDSQIEVLDDMAYNLKGSKREELFTDFLVEELNDTNNLLSRKNQGYNLQFKGKESIPYTIVQVDSMRSSTGIIETIESNLPISNYLIYTISSAVANFAGTLLEMLDSTGWRGKGVSDFANDSRFKDAKNILEKALYVVYIMALNVNDEQQKGKELKDIDFSFWLDNFKQYPKTPRSANTNTGWNWRFKTEKEFIDEYGAAWFVDANPDVEWNRERQEYDMDFLFGQPITQNPTSKNVIDALIEDNDNYRVVNVDKYFGIKNPNANGRVEYAIAKEFITDKPLPTAAASAPTAAPTQQMSSFPSTNSITWSGEFNVGDNVKIRYDYSTDRGDGASNVPYDSPQNAFKITGKSILAAMVRPENPRGILYNLSNGQKWEGKDLESVLPVKPYAAAPQTTSTQPAWNWRFKTKAEFEKEYGRAWKVSLNWISSNKMDYLFGQPLQEKPQGKIVIDKFVSKTFNTQTVNTEGAFGLVSPTGDNMWEMKFEMFTQKPLPVAAPPTTQTQQGQPRTREVYYNELLYKGVLKKSEKIVGARFLTVEEIDKFKKEYQTDPYSFGIINISQDYIGGTKKDVAEYAETQNTWYVDLFGKKLDNNLLPMVQELFKFQKSLDPVESRKLFRTIYTQDKEVVKNSRLRIGTNTFVYDTELRFLFPKVTEPEYVNETRFRDIQKSPFPDWYKAMIQQLYKSREGTPYSLTFDDMRIGQDIIDPYYFFTGERLPKYTNINCSYLELPTSYLMLEIEDTDVTPTATKKKVKKKETVYYKELLEQGMPKPNSKIVGARFLTENEISGYNKKYGTSLAGLELSLDCEIVMDKKALQDYEFRIKEDIKDEDDALKWSGNAVLGKNLNPNLLPMAIALYEFDKDYYTKNKKSLYLTTGLEKTEQKDFLQKSRLLFGMSAPFEENDFWKPLFPTSNKTEFREFQSYQDIIDYKFPDWYKSFLKEILRTTKEYYLSANVNRSDLADDAERTLSITGSVFNVPSVLTGTSNTATVNEEQGYLFLPMSYLMFEIETEEFSSTNSTAVKKLKEEYAALQYYLNVEVPIDAFAQRKLISSAMETVSDNLEKEIEALYYSPSFEPLFEFWAEKQTQGQRMIDLQPCMLPTPNGEKSELDLVQYEIVRSEEFKKWFGDWEEAAKTGNYNGVSKAINPLTKEPQVVFHGKANMVLEFSKMAFALFPVKYFGTNLSYAEWFKINQSKSDRLTKLVYEFFVDIKNPIDLSPIGLTELTAEDLKEVIKAQYNYEIQSPIAGEGTGDKTKLWRLIRGSEQMLEELKANTYFDGLIMYEDNLQDLTASGYDTGLLGFSPNSYELVQQVAGTPIGNFTLDFVTFTNFQIKAADGRNTTFFNNVEDFRFAKGGITKKRKK